MDSLHLHTHWVPDVTLIPNRFLDEYMPRANGEFVKIYLYLLRSAGNTRTGRDVRER